MTAPEPPAPFVTWDACTHGLSPDEVRLDRDEDYGARYIYLDQERHLSIRIQMTPRPAEDPARYAARLERDRKGLRALAARCVQVAQEIEQAQRGEATS